MAFPIHINRIPKLDQPPQRIVCLVPSLSELLVDLGLKDRVVGCTQFCVHPSFLRQCAKSIGGTKNPRIDQILSLKPDLVIAEKEENTKADVEQLAKHVPVYVADIQNIADATTTVTSIGGLCAISDQAAHLVKLLHQAHRAIAQKSVSNSRTKVAYCIWKQPWMFAGGDTYINSMLELHGYENVLKDQLRYPSMELAELPEDVELVLLSSEPYRFKERHCIELRATYPHVRFELVDGERFSWYGSRILHLEGLL